MARIGYFLVISLLSAVAIPQTVFAQFEVVSTNPKQNEINVEPDASISIGLSKEISSIAIPDTSIRVRGSLSGLHQTVFEYLPDTKTIIVRPITPFLIGEVIDVTITKSLKAIRGESLSQAFGFRFTIKVNYGGSVFPERKVVGLDAVLSESRTVTVGDFDNDERLEIAVSENVFNKVIILKQNDHGDFSKSSVTQISGLDIYDFVIGDFDNDWDVDIITVNSESDDISFVQNQGNGFFIELNKIAVGNRPISGEAADFNSDGFLDLVIVNLGIYEIIL
jgi:hypothetical protein